MSERGNRHRRPVISGPWALAATIAGVVALALATAPATPAEWVGAEKLDEAIHGAIAEGLTPGAVAWIESRGERLHYKSYGSRSIVPDREPMTPDTVFDCASLTKVIATAPSIMLLVEEGKVRLNDSVARYLPEFSDQSITVRQLLTHYSGLPPVLKLDPPWSGYATGIGLAMRQRPTHAPGSRFVYSDINYILLAEIIRTVSGVSVDRFASQRIFEPLGMKDTVFLPPENLRARIAPTERLGNGEVLRGVVHDPTTRAMGGVSGQAGLFSTAEDVATFARMMVSGGEVDGVRILSPLSVLRMRTPQSPEGKAARGIGWDIDTAYSSPRGDLFGTASYGHTGYTGPSLWIDPDSESFVVLMTNRVHPRASTSVVRLRSFVASIVAANLSPETALPPETRRDGPPLRDMPFYAEVKTGLDVLVEENFERLRGKRVGLLTNHTGIDRTGRRNIDLFAAADRLSLEMIFSPEHGLEGILDQPEVADSEDPESGVKVHSLYQGERRRPAVELLERIDALVFDVQDIGARFYTYITTMGYAMEAAAAADIEFYVLDRPNPINGTSVEGPILEDALESFVGYHSLPIRHGMTVGELARMFNKERGIGVNLTVVPMQGWDRRLWFDETGLPWVNPSPNIRTLDQATLYPGIAMLEWLEDYSVGRGTDTPFRFVGADWIDGAALAAALHRTPVPGVRVYARKHRPRASVFEGTLIDGVQFTVTDRRALEPTLLGLALAAALRDLYPDNVDFTLSEKLIGNQNVTDGLLSGRSATAISDGFARSITEFRLRRSGFLLYQ